MRNAVTLLALSCVACGTEAPNPRFSFVEEADPTMVAVLKSDSTITPLGFRVVELHVLLPARVTEPIARASLQHLIDSVAAADTLAAGVRVVGFLMGAFDLEDGSAELEPAMSAFWEPTDSVGITGSNRTARFRTTFRLLKPFPADQATEQQ